MHTDISMAQCKTAVTPLLTQWSYCSLVLSPQLWNIPAHLGIDMLQLTSFITQSDVKEICCMQHNTNIEGTLAPGRCGSHFKSIISINMSQIKNISTSCGIGLRWIPQNTFDGKLPLNQVRTFCEYFGEKYLRNIWEFIVSGPQYRGAWIKNLKLPNLCLTLLHWQFK